jgi:hypothetical protein
MSATCTVSLPECINSPRLTLVWRVDADHVLEIGGDGRTGDGRIRYVYRLSRHGQTVFEGQDFCSGSGAAPVAATLGHAAGCLLGFLAMRPGDVESDYFAEYTPQQRQWRDAFAEDLSTWAQDGRCGYCGGNHDSAVQLCC